VQFSSEDDHTANSIFASVVNGPIAISTAYGYKNGAVTSLAAGGRFNHFAEPKLCGLFRIFAHDSCPDKDRRSGQSRSKVLGGAASGQGKNGT
jgi:hypothetical protein